MTSTKPGGAFSHMSRVFIYGLLALVLIIVFGVYTFLEQQKTKQNDNINTLLSALWQNYKTSIWDGQTGQTINQQTGGTTTSEAQGYTMLRSVWENDQPTFDKTWQWTKNNLQRPDHLFSWDWGKTEGGVSGILVTNGGNNTASDADTDIAFALVMAAARWHNQEYLSAAQQIISSIWQTEVVSVNGVPYLAADNIEKTAETPSFVINPSYFAPYAYRVFARIDQKNNWIALVNSSYTVLKQVSLAPLNTDIGASAGLPPDWALVDRKTGNLSALNDPSRTTDFSYNAFRVMWRVGLDYEWNRDSRAKALLSNFNFLSIQWQDHHELLADYSHSGQAKVDYMSYAMDGGVLGYFMFTHSSQAQAIASRLLSLLDQKTAQLSRSLDYYDNSWVWFGLALYQHNLPNIARDGGII